MKLLCLSNGHGEDVIAVRILEQLQRHPQAPEIVALPLVGEGHAYTKLGIPLVGPVQKMPSGGFIYMDGREFWRDIQGGLLQLTLAQYRLIRQWGKIQQPEKRVILAVGDIVPLLFAWLSGADYAFVGTAKSEYYWRDEGGWLPQTSWLERHWGGIYLPWERWLLSRRRCKAVFPRDTLTAESLQQRSIAAFDLGNPMMDGLDEVGRFAEPHPPSPPLLKGEGGTTPELGLSNPRLTIVLLPGSRMPEAERNWQLIMEAAAGVISAFSDRSVVFLGAIAPDLSLDSFQASLALQGWKQQSSASLSSPIPDSHALAFSRDKGTVLLSQNTYRECLLAANLAIAMAGTATEQFVGLGKPAIAIAGKGPQYTPAFAEAQTRLLGPSLILVQQPQQVAGVIQSLLADGDRCLAIAENGRRRMGSPGAAARIANCLLEKFGSS